MKLLGMKSDAWLKKMQEIGDPEGCIYCGAMAGTCGVYPRCPTGYENGASPRFFIDHGVVHDLKTGKHVESTFWEGNQGCTENLLALLLELDAKAPDVKAMTNRFLGWKLPEDFGPDCGISFTPLGHPNGWPIGTNLFTATQAQAMFEYCLKTKE